MTDKTKLNEAIKVIKTLREDAKLALKGAWDRSDDGFRDQIILIDKFLSSLESEPKGKLKQGKLGL